MLAVLRRRDFALLWSSGLISVAGDWALMVALPLYVFTATGSTLATAGMTVAELGPAVVLTSFTGVLADRWDRKRILVGAAAAQAAVVASLVLVPEGRLWLVYAVAAVQSSIAAFAQPAEAALLPSLVPRSELVPANALNVLNNRLGRLVGVALGAAIFTTWGLAGVVAADALSFLLAAALVLAVHAPGDTSPAAPAETSFWQEWVDGLGIVRANRMIAALFLVFSTMTFGGTMLDPLFAPWVRSVLDQDVAVVALLTTVSSTAGIATSLLVGGLAGRVAPRTLVGWGSVVAGVMLVVKFSVPVVWVVVALTALGGLTAVASSVGVETLAQERTPDHVRGRVFGSLQTIIWLASLLGAATGGVLGQVFSLPLALDVAAILVTASGVLALLCIPPVGRTLTPDRESDLPASSTARRGATT